MAKKVNGFMTSDGEFYKTKAEADYWEARSVLEGLLLGIWNDPVPVITFVENNYGEVEAFIKAHQRIQQLNTFVQQSRALHTESEQDQGDDTGGEEDAASIQHQPPHKREYVPNVGRSISAKEIRNRRKKHGSRSGKANARRVRGSEDLATGVQTDSAKTR